MTFTRVYKIIEESIKRNKDKRPGILIGLNCFLIFMDRFSCIQAISKLYPNSIRVFFNEPGGETEAKVLKMENKG